MDYASSWDFTLANYGPVWSFMVQMGLLLLFLMVGNILRRTIPLFRKCLIPSALLARPCSIRSSPPARSPCTRSPQASPP